MSDSSVDLDHLRRQTLNDPALEREVLELFEAQIGTAVASLPDAELQQRRAIAHGLVGAARGVGAVRVAESAAALEQAPDKENLLEALLHACREVADFIADFKTSEANS